MTWSGGEPLRIQVGDEWLTILQVARRYGFTAACIRYRHKVGWSFEEMTTRPPWSGRAKPDKPGRWSYQGRPVSQKELAVLAGISEPAMSYRLRYLAMTPEQAVAKGNTWAGRKSKPDL